MNSIIEKLNKKGETLIKSIYELLDTCGVYYSNPNDQMRGVVYIGFPSWHWTIKDELKTGKAQVTALKQFKYFTSVYNLLLKNYPEKQINEIKKEQGEIIGLIERSRDPNGSINSMKFSIEKIIKKHLNLLQRLVHDKKRIMLVPDTNSIIKCPDPKDYEIIAGSKEFTFVLTPTLNRELDKLKVIHRDDSFRNKVQSIIKRIKGYRIQGSLLDGVIYNKSITIRAIATEPNFDSLLSWLDPANEDDIFIASVLEIIVGSPGDSIMLITADINLQNKAELALITYAEPPDS